MRRILIVGAGGHGQVVADVLLAAYRNGGADVPVGFVDDDEGLSGATIVGLPVLGSLSRLDAVEHDALIVAIGDNRVRRSVLLKLARRGAQIARAVHPSAVIAPDAKLGAGVVICAAAVVNTGSLVGDGAILNTGCTIDHHNVIGDFAHVAPGAHLGGEVRVGEGALIGIGASVKRGCSIGMWSTVGVGAAVVHDIPPDCTAVGVPARVIKRRSHHE